MKLLKLSNKGSGIRYEVKTMCTRILFSFTMSVFLLVSTIAGANNDSDVPKMNYFEMPEHERLELVRILDSISLGDSIDSVRKKLGNPDNESAIFVKGLNSNIRGVSWKYYVIKVSNSANEQDKLVILRFSNDGGLRLIDSNLPEYERIEGSSP